MCLILKIGYGSPQSEMAAFSRRYNGDDRYTLFETSSKTGENVSAVFERIAHDHFMRLKENESSAQGFSESVKLDSLPSNSQQLEHDGKGARDCIC